MKTKITLLTIASLLSLGACSADEMPLPEPEARSESPQPTSIGAPETPAPAGDAGLEQPDAADMDAAANTDADAGDAGPPLPTIIDDPPNEEKTKAPTKAEWKTAPYYQLYRNEADNECKAQKLREWLRIRCEGWGYAGISVVSGSRDGLDVAVQISDTGSDGAHLILPMRKGDRRLVLFMTQSKWSKVPTFVVSEQWLPSDKGPIVSILDI